MIDHFKIVNNHFKIIIDHSKTIKSYHFKTNKSNRNNVIVRLTNLRICAKVEDIYSPFFNLTIKLDFYFFNFVKNLGKLHMEF